MNKCLCKLFGDHGQELFAVGMLVDRDNRPECNSATTFGNDRISYCRLLYMLINANNANTAAKQWAAIYNSASSYNMLYKREGFAFLKKIEKKKSKRKKSKRKKSKRKKSKRKKTKRHKKENKQS